MPRTNTSMVKIVDSAGQLFSAKGYHPTSMDDIAAGAGVAKGTLYYNFPTKASLFKAVVADGIESLMNEVYRAIDDDVPPLAQIESVIRLHIHAFARHPHIVKIMFNEMSGGLDLEIREYVDELRAKYEAFLLDLLELGVREGYVRDLDRNLLAGTLMDLIYSAAGHLGEHPDRDDEDAVYRFLETLLFDGVFQGEKE